MVKSGTKQSATQAQALVKDPKSDNFVKKTGVPLFDNSDHPPFDNEIVLKVTNNAQMDVQTELLLGIQVRNQILVKSLLLLDYTFADVQAPVQR